ncbi:hypothetical protein ACIBI7_39325 [Nonomuraea fuscirosea]|uniref:hypothetical protein n=1 Tax=Nonomuraea fuscirosea TaxID=1291556 RepID=UPI0037B4F034
MDAVHRRFLAALVAPTPVLPEAARFAYLDVDDTIRATHGYAKQGAGYGYSKVKGLNALVAIVSTPTCAPLVAPPAFFATELLRLLRRWTLAHFDGRPSDTR